MSSSEAGYQPGDWHETLVDLLVMDRSIPEDRARRFLAHHAEEVRGAAPPPGEQRSDALAAIDRVHAVTTVPEVMDAKEADHGSYRRGYEHGVLAAKSALRSPTEPTSKKPHPASASADHPCAHCTHPKRAHIADPVWCRHCPPDTSYVAAPGWHEYEPAEVPR